MELAMVSVEIGKQRLADCSFCFFGMMAKVFEDDYAPYLNATAERLFQSCQKQEVDEDFEDEDDLNVEGNDAEHISGYAINNAIAEEKETAVDALGVIFENTCKHFGAHFERLVQTVQELSDNGHEGVRKSCIGTFFRMLCTLWRNYHDNQEWSAGLPAAYAIHPHLRQLIKIVMDESLKTYDEEEDKTVIAALNSEITDAMRLMGPVLIENHVEQLSQHIMNLLGKKAVCQAEPEDEEGDMDDDEDQAEYDALVISTTADVIGMMALAIGEKFVSYFSHFWPHIAKYYKPSKPVSERSMAVGVLGETIEGIKAEITPFTQDIVHLVMNALSDEDEEVRSNAAFATGMLSFYTTMDLSS